MLVAANLAIVVLLALCIGLELTARRLTPPQPTPSAVGTNPAFRYLLALSVDWLQGPNLYKLYRNYSFLESQIAILYVVVLASCVLFAPVASRLTQVLGRRRTCLLFCVTYSACCLTKLSRDYLVLILGRMPGCLSTSLLSTAFEAWYVHTFTKAASWNHGLAVGAGLVANMLAVWLHLGPVVPFLLAVPCMGNLWLGGADRLRPGEEGWKSGRGQQDALARSAPLARASARARFWRNCQEGLRCLLSDRRVMLLGGVQALFESVLYIFIFLWTPVLDHYGPPLGIPGHLHPLLPPAWPPPPATASSLATSSHYCLQPGHLHPLLPPAWSPPPATASSLVTSTRYCLQPGHLHPLLPPAWSPPPATASSLATSTRYCLQPGHLHPLLPPAWSPPPATASSLLTFFSFFMLIFSTAPGQTRPHESLLAFLLLELDSGLYFPAVSFLQGRVIPEEKRAGVLAWFRLPLHLMACLGLLAFHREVSGTEGGEGGS
ncbi:unnamed protein product [Coregonus sp. 'balchen']|nr:unnamed protein product [Coregonus sp. 'balchen']